MTDRHSGYVITLVKDVREDDAQGTIAAIAQLRSVVSVKPVISDFNLIIAAERARRELIDKLWEALK